MTDLVFLPYCARGVPTAGVPCVWAGVDNAWEQAKLEARKMGYPGNFFLPKTSRSANTMTHGNIPTSRTKGP